MKTLRCIHVITRLILGGAQENTLLTVEGLDRLGGFRTTLISGPAAGPEGELEARARRNGVDLLLMPELVREIAPRRDWAAYRALTEYFRREKPEIVHTHSSKAGVLGRLAARRAGVPVIIHTVHGPSFHPHESPVKNYLYRKLEWWAARDNARLICVADAMTDQYVAAGVAPRGKFVTIYSGMEVDPFVRETDARARVRRELGIGADEVVIGKVARLFELKGHDDLIDAFGGLAARFPKARLMFVGDGLLRGALEARAAALGLRERVTFAGLVPPERVPDMIKAMDLLVHASLREGLARVLPQSLLSGCPAISYDVDGAREVIRNGETGWLVPARDMARLRDAIAEALADLPRARRMALRGRELFADQFRAETMVRRIAEVYREEMAKVDT
jgi:glycosyltransferase involved in cell wall biosynthesis